MHIETTLEYDMSCEGLHKLEEEMAIAASYTGDADLRKARIEVAKTGDADLRKARIEVAKTGVREVAAKLGLPVFTIKTESGHELVFSKTPEAMRLVSGMIGNMEAPPGLVWRCEACGKTSRWKYGFDHDGGRDGTSRGWDASCMMNCGLVLE